MENENAVNSSPGLRSRKTLQKVVPKIARKNISPIVKRTFIEYCENSTIQGMNYLVRDSSKFEKTWWYSTLGLCVILCIYNSYQYYANWRERPILVSLATQELGIWEIPFPAVTFCPETKVSKQFCLDYTQAVKDRRNGVVLGVEQNTYFDLMSLTCSPSNYGNLSEGKEFFPEEDYFDFLYGCRSVDLEVSYCKWMGELYPCKDILKPILTDEGLCYNFNMQDVYEIYADDVVKHDWDVDLNESDVWDPDHGFRKGYFMDGIPRRAVEPGTKSSLMVALFTPKNDIINSCRPYTFQGMRVSFHMPNRIPRPSEVFFQVGLETLVSASILPSMSFTSDDVKSFEPEVRNCYFTKERKLRYFKTYSQAHCKMECHTNFTLDYCDCVAFYMPRDNNTRVCGLAKLRCLDLASQFLSNQDIDDDIVSILDSCDCRPLCVDITYNVEISDDEWHWYEQVLVQETDENNQDELKDFSVAAARIFFRDSYFLPKQRRELMETSDLISKFGGILGLFTGFSLFSLAEIIYFFAKVIIHSCKKSVAKPSRSPETFA